MKFDVLIITALREELEAVLSLTEDHSALSFTDKESANWSEDKDTDEFPFHYREFATKSGDALVVAAARAVAMGETAAADRCRALVAHLNPLCVAMTGICAGRKGSTFLGDVIVANRVFSYDHGKLVATTTPEGKREIQLFREIETYNLEKTWAISAEDFAEEVAWLNQLLGKRPLSLDVQRRWLLRILLLQESGEDPGPQSEPERRKLRFPRWPDVIAKLEADKDAAFDDDGVLKLTEKGRKRAREDYYKHPEEPEPDPDFQVHVGPIGTGKTVVQDAEIFKELAEIERTILGLEMEAAAIGFVAENVGLPSIIAKGVIDFADADKDGLFRTFAARASIAFLIAFLKKHPPRLTLARHATPVLVSEEHGAELRQMAKKWAEWFSLLLQPAWAVHALTLGRLDSEKELTELRQHFPQFNTLYAEWYGLNASLAGIPTVVWEMPGGQGGWGDKPTNPEDDAFVRQHNDVVRDLVSELKDIEFRQVITGQCDLCK